jgi:hypothetical protein
MVGHAVRSLLPWAIVASACGQSGVDQDQRSSPRRADEAMFAGVGRAGLLRFELELEPSRPAVGELFRVVTTVRGARSGTPLERAQFVLDATMPSHGHGMATSPEHRELGAGRYLSEGMKFHMPGPWELEARAIADHLEDVIALEYEQPVTGG